MSSRFSNKFPIPEKFPEILHDFAREVVRYMPKDILDFAIQYFFSLEQNVPLKYTEGGSKDIPKISYALDQKEKSKQNRETISTPSLATNPNTQNMFYKQTETKKKLEIGNEIKEVKETFSSKINSPIGTEESKPDSNRTNGSGVVGLSKNFVNKVFENNQKKVQEAMNMEQKGRNKGTDHDNKGENSNRSGATFSNISGTSSTKNGVRNFVGVVFEDSKKSALESQK